MREWIETNGLGGYASLSQKMQATRKFHGLLIASRNPPVDRWVFVSNVLDELLVDGTVIPLSNYATFSFDYFPTWIYETPYGIIKKTVCMPHKQNTTMIRYESSLDQPVNLQHQLLLTSRHFYDVIDQPNPFSYQHTTNDNSILFQPENVDQTVTILFPHSSIQSVNKWIPQTYHIDCQRNDSCYDHVLHLASIQRSIPNQESSYSLIFSTEKRSSFDANTLYSTEKQRRRTVLQKASLPDNMNRLVLSADRFIVKKPPYHTIIAGYHWFSDWGRDTLISLPGITLVTGRFEIAKEILQGLATYAKNGLIPNTFDDRDSSPAYNTVDATLWYIDRVLQYLKYTNDKAFLNKFYPVLEDIIAAYKEGSNPHMFMDDDYLISHDPGLTWMDVKLGEYYPTPRARKAVEIQALWYNALRIMSLFARLTDKPDHYDELAEKVKASFNQRYSKLYDVLDTRDDSIRPNMIFLASLDFSMISTNLQQQIVDVVEEKLLTIFGLRTLDPSDPQYKDSYIGSYHRDLAYHNGTVWTWLLGAFIKAKARLHAENPEWEKEAFDAYLSTLLHVYGDKWDGSIHEIFDAEPPFAPRGCMAQAWSVAEVLRAWTEDILGKRPPFESVFTSNEIRV
ncbi:MAG: glycogen debranching enzyme family protein [Candidatus Thermoplasmatota archaeon]|nr:glycogen debranching enzyme family protein [Candidatus Thermoplasmatota archaeon]